MCLLQQNDDEAWTRSLLFNALFYLALTGRACPSGFTQERTPSLSNAAWHTRNHATWTTRKVISDVVMCPLCATEAVQLRSQNVDVLHGSGYAEECIRNVDTIMARMPQYHSIHASMAILIACTTVERGLDMDAIWNMGI